MRSSFTPGTWRSWFPPHSVVSASHQSSNTRGPGCLRAVAGQHQFPPFHGLPSGAKKGSLSFPHRHLSGGTPRMKAFPPIRGNRPSKSLSPRDVGPPQQADGQPKARPGLSSTTSGPLTPSRPWQAWGSWTPPRLWRLIAHLPGPGTLWRPQ